MGYHRAGFEILGVDHEPQPRYPFRFVQGDALAYLEAHGNEFDAIHASPPCQIHSQTNNYTPGDTRGHVDLVSPTRAALIRNAKPWIIENVEGAPLRRDIRLCASGFGLPMRRHRIFEASFPLPLAPPCNHWSNAGAPCKGQNPATFKPGVFVSPTGNPNKRKGTLKQWLAAMETPWMDRRGVTQAIPPAYTEFLGKALLIEIRRNQRART